MKKFKQSIISKSLSSKNSLFKPEIKASRITINSRTCNQAKFDEFYNIIDLAKDYKNLVSSYCFNNLTSLVINYSDFLTHYKLLPSKQLNAWERQAIFQEITGHYYETATRYLAKTTYTLNSQQSIFKNEEINKVKTRLNSIAILIDKESNLISTKNLTQEQSYSLDFDVKLKLECKLKEIGRTIENILSKDNPQVLIKSEQLRIGRPSRKIHLIFKYERSSNLGHIIENKKFVAPNSDNTNGIDINLKHNLLADSNGNIYDEILKESTLNNKNKFIDNLNEIVVLQSIETDKRTEKETYRYKKLLRCNESLLKTYLSGLIKDWKQQGILHLALEDLNFLNDKSYYEHAGVKIKYSRLSRLLRLGKIKLWIAQMASSQGLFTHTVNPAYTSQECNHCHHISHLNRTKQESFKCTNKNCSYHNIEVNADTNAAINIKNRLLNKQLREKLNKDNVYLCSKPKQIYYKKVKTIIDEVYKLNGVVTELLPKQATSRLHKKEASS